MRRVAGIILLVGVCEKCDGAGRAGKAWVCLASTGHAPWADRTEVEQGLVMCCSVYWCVLEEPGSAPP